MVHGTYSERHLDILIFIILIEGFMIGPNRRKDAR
jgi:hypothetical protein